MEASEDVPPGTKVLVLDMDMMRWTTKDYGALTETERATLRQVGELWMALTGPYAWTEAEALGARACLPPIGPQGPVHALRTKPTPGEFVVLVSPDGSGVGMVPACFLSQAQQATLSRKRSGDVVPWWTAQAVPDGETEADYLRTVHHSVVEIGGALEAQRDRWRGRAKTAEAALSAIAVALAPYTVDGAEPSPRDIPGILAVLLRQRDEGAMAGVVGPVLHHSLTMVGHLMAPGAPPPTVLRKEWRSDVGVVTVPDVADEECSVCHQSGEGRGGEAPCATCGRNTLHDPEEE